MGIIVERKTTFAPLSILDSNPVHCLLRFCYTCRLDCLSSSIFKCLAVTLQTNISNFLPHFWYGISKNKECPWISLEKTEPGPLHYPDGSQTSGTWALSSHLTDGEGPTWHLVLCKCWSLQIKWVRKTSSRQGGTLLPPKMPEQDYLLHLTWSPSFFSSFDSGSDLGKRHHHPYLPGHC